MSGRHNEATRKLKNCAAVMKAAAHLSRVADPRLYCLFKSYELETVIANTTQSALKWGCQWVGYWQLYCNENYEGIVPPIDDNEDMRGFWLISPDGTYSWTWYYLYGLPNDQDLPSFTGVF